MHFSKLMQGKIFRDKEIKIKVKEELEIVQFYLFLQKERYQDKLMYEINLSDEQIKENLYSSTFNRTTCGKCCFTWVRTSKRERNDKSMFV